MSVVSIPAGSPDSAYLAAIQQAKREIRPAAQSSLLPDASGSTVIELGPGDHIIPGPLLGREGMTAKAAGITFRGQGSYITNAVISGPAAFQNDFWQAVTIEKMRLIAAKPGLSGLQWFTQHSAQKVNLDDVVFEKFKRPIELQGDNNNSEWSITRCTDFGTEDGGAFLYIGAANTSDQFLNYWISKHRHWGSSAPIIDAARGGHFHLRDVDASNWGSTAGAKLFNLRGTEHSWGVCALTVDALRVEIMNAAAGLLYSEWPLGNVALRGVDVGSQIYKFGSYGDMVVINYPGPYPGAKYTIADSTLAGNINVTGTPTGASVRVRDAFWLGTTTPAKGTGAAIVSFDNVTAITSGGVKTLNTLGGGDMFTDADRKLLTDARNAAVNFAWEGHPQLGVTDGRHKGGDGKLIPAGLPLSFLDYQVQKNGPA